MDNIGRERKYFCFQFQRMFLTKWIREDEKKELKCRKLFEYIQHDAVVHIVY